MAVRVLLADDHVLVREGIKALLEREGFEVVAQACNGHEAIHLTEKFRPEVSVLDICMPLLNGIDAAREISRVSPRTRIVMVSMYTEERYVLTSLRAGVSAYVLKTRGPAELVQAIHGVMRGETYLSSGVSRTVVQAYLHQAGPERDPLTVREREVLQLVAEGKTTKEIAGVLGTSIKTIEAHRTHINEKLDIHDNAGLVRYAIREGIIAA